MPVLTLDHSPVPAAFPMKKANVSLIRGGSGFRSSPRCNISALIDFIKEIVGLPFGTQSLASTRNLNCDRDTAWPWLFSCLTSRIAEFTRGMERVPGGFLSDNVGLIGASGIFLGVVPLDDASVPRATSPGP